MGQQVSPGICRTDRLRLRNTCIRSHTCSLCAFTVLMACRLLCLRREWEKAAANTNRPQFVVPRLRQRLEAEMVTVAWAKMYESIVACDLLPEGGAVAGGPGVVTVHLCEAPGAFVCATNHFVKTQRQQWRWDWMAVRCGRAMFFVCHCHALTVHTDGMPGAHNACACAPPAFIQARAASSCPRTPFCCVYTSAWRMQGCCMQDGWTWCR